MKLWPFKSAPTSIDVDDIRAGKVQVMRNGKPMKLGQRRYLGADRNALTKDWFAGSSNADAELWGDLSTLRNRSRQLVRDNGYVKGAAAQIVNNVIGSGYNFQPQLRNANGELDEETNKAIEALFWRWAMRSKYCDAQKRLTFTGLCRQILHAWWQDGEVLIQKVHGIDRGMRVPMFLKVIEADHLDHNYSDENPETGNKINMGVEVDGFGAPAAYWVWDKHPGNIWGGQSNKRRRIDARDIIHFYLPTRPGQTRGVPQTHAVMWLLRQLGAYQEAEVLAARIGAQTPLFLENSGELPEDADGTAFFDQAFGSIPILPEGTKLSTFNSQHPATAFDPFMQAVLRGIAAGLDLSYESVTRDFSKTSFSSARTALLSERDTYKTLQFWFADQVLMRIYEWFLDAAHMKDALDVPGYYDQKGTRESVVESAQWIGRGWPWIDPRSEYESDLGAVSNNMKPLSDVIAQQGGDLEDVARRIQNDRKVLAKYGLAYPDVKAAKAATPPAEEITDDKPDDDTKKQGNGKSHPATAGLLQ